MSDPNMITVFDKNGDSFEMTKANARDLVEHAGWSYTRPTIIEKVVEKVVEVPAAPVAAPVAEEPKTETPVTETAADDTGEEQLLKTEEAFKDMDRDAVAAYLNKHFPDATFHHKTGREKLVELAITLATDA